MKCYKFEEDQLIVSADLSSLSDTKFNIVQVNTADTNIASVLVREVQRVTYNVLLSAAWIRIRSSSIWRWHWFSGRGQLGGRCQLCYSSSTFFTNCTLAFAMKTNILNYVKKLYLWTFLRMGWIFFRTCAWYFLS